MNPSAKGSVAEAVIAAEAVKLGVVVLRPIVEGRRYDLIFDIAGALLRVQCKSAPRRGEVIVVRTGTSRLTPRGYVRTTYTASEVDAIAIYCPDTDECYLLPISEVDGQAGVHLRLTPAINGQQLAIRYAEQYRLNGAIAQLGERLAGSQKVGGSSPPGSTDREAA
jgi:hypothetical protein